MGAKSKSPYFAARLREAMDAKGYTQEGLARELTRVAGYPISLSAVTAWIYKESEPRGKQLALLTRVLDQDAAWFFPDSEPPERKAA